MALAKADPAQDDCREPASAKHVAKSSTFTKRIRAMAKDLSRDEEKRGTGKVFMWGAVIIALLFVALMAVFILGPFWS
ncbi:hypothetical protein [Mesorhizobium sp.]|uniref:hypothetical protein n=1 Tax=Mesorhizobium sp. TaxID=1871066 RepID=UPI000FE7106C|nr:hypothetical protein [Mesorhizobium sp.]RWD31857.1 MAG: hypothetical protein EOS34_23170 [Mesorhizobium sp.]RWD78165.1 MAG: hypothetical protein EOS48_25375 [Mesorhizobium sp.]TIS40964.1 MAG: hypothetical protein E5W95_10960 [Mesorhizobium sp.]